MGKTVLRDWIIWVEKMLCEACSKMMNMNLLGMVSLRIPGSISHIKPLFLKRIFKIFYVFFSVFLPFFLRLVTCDSERNGRGTFRPLPWPRTALAAAQRCGGTWLDGWSLETQGRWWAMFCTMWNSRMWRCHMCHPRILFGPFVTCLYDWYWYDVAQTMWQRWVLWVWYGFKVARQRASSPPMFFRFFAQGRRKHGNFKWSRFSNPFCFDLVLE